ncbi:MAG TPA: carboxymuconolactone decarboxylase family protein [Gemmatimonadales bacterium]|nr:carboxymuconolactone decarboxylase family protein [Gemmatimonadales bacterium]
MVDYTLMLSEGFKAFLAETPGQARAWSRANEELGAASALDPKTRSLAYLAVLAALGLESGVPFHATLAREAGASRAEVLSAILVGLPAAGHVVTQVLPAAIRAYDAAPR